MAHFKRFMTTTLLFGLAGMVLVTFVAPTISKMLISAPVSFGMNCEPAANWSVDMLIRSQVIGFIVGGILGSLAYLYLRSKYSRSKSSEVVA